MFKKCIIIREQVIVVFLICMLPQQQYNQLNLALNCALIDYKLEMSMLLANFSCWRIAISMSRWNFLQSCKKNWMGSDSSPVVGRRAGGGGGEGEVNNAP